MIDWSLFEKSFAPLFCADNGRPPKPIRLMSGLLMLKHLRNEYDGHTIDRAKEQAHRLYGRTICILAGDRGYRGQKMSGDTKVMIPDVPKASDSAYLKARKHELFRKRAGIEPVIGYCKSDHRLGRNFYKGLFGDSINVMHAAAAFNLKRAMRLFLCLFKWVIRRLMTEGHCPVITCNACTCAHVRSF